MTLDYCKGSAVSREQLEVWISLSASSNKLLSHDMIVSSNLRFLIREIVVIRGISSLKSASPRTLYSLVYIFDFRRSVIGPPDAIGFLNRPGALTSLRL